MPNFHIHGESCSQTNLRRLVNKPGARNSTDRCHHGPIVEPSTDLTVIDCETCAFRHVVPLPTDEELEARYRSYYFSEDKPLYFDQLEEDVEWWRMVHAERFDRYERILKPDQRRILDVGAGAGAFLKTGMDRGWAGMAVEPGEQGAQHIRNLGIEVVEAFFTAENTADLGTFDVIHMYTLIEHVSDPGAMIQLCRGMLNPGGLLDIAFPNDYNPLQLLLVEHFDFPPWWIVPVHISYFTPRSAQGFLTDGGFKVVSRTASFPIEMFLLMGDNYLSDNATGRAAHQRVKNLELALTRGGRANLKNSLYEGFIDNGLGRAIEFLAVVNQD